MEDSKIIKFAYDKLRINQKPLEFKELWKNIIKDIEIHIDNKDYIDIVIYKDRRVGASVFGNMLLVALSQLKDNFNSLYFSSTAQTCNNIYFKNICLEAIHGKKRFRDGRYKTCIEENISYGSFCNRKNYKQFKNGSSINLNSIRNYESCLRGNSFDLIIFDLDSINSETLINSMRCSRNSLRVFIIEGRDYESFWEAVSLAEKDEIKKPKKIYDVSEGNL